MWSLLQKSKKPAKLDGDGGGRMDQPRLNCQHRYANISKKLFPGVCISLSGVMVRVSLVLRRTVGDSDISSPTVLFKTTLTLTITLDKH